MTNSPASIASQGAVFLSYAREDTTAAQRISEALRSHDIEVWFDQNELRGGDAWDQKIRRQIKECALFVPLISANTQERGEGYFRREWKLGAERTHDMAAGMAFLFPVSIDDTTERGASVPDEFLRAHWTRLPGALPTPQFVEQVRRLLGGSRQPEGSAPKQESAQLPAARAKSIAVLAFANLSRDPENEYFSDGISEELLNVLAKIPGLKVSARTSAFHFKGKDTPIPEIARQLGVAFVVEGSVRKSGSQVRITAQLINAADGFHVWSDTFTRELKDIFAVQDEIAGLVAQKLQLKLGESARPARPVNPEAHRLVLEGRHFWTLRTDAGFARANEAFARALTIDPQFAPAHAGLADVAAVRAWYGTLGGDLATNEELRRAAAEAEVALDIDPLLAAAHAAMAVVSFLQHRWADAERQFQRAFQLNPNYAVAYHWHAHLLAAQGRLDEALAELEKSIALDPLSFVTLVIYASQLNFARRYEDVISVTDRALALRSTVIAPLQGARATAFLALGRREEAVAAARVVEQEELWWMRWWASEEALYVLMRTGSEAEAAKLCARWRPNLEVDSTLHGPMLQALGRFDEALPFLERTPPSMFSRFYYLPIWDGVRDNPRFRQLIAKLGCESEYRTGRETLARMLRERKTDEGPRGR
jgi:TolB-like protein